MPIDMCAPGDDVSDMAKEAIEMGAREGLPDRRRRSDIDRGWRHVIPVLIALVVGFLLPQVTRLTSSDAAMGASTGANQSQIVRLEQRLYAAEQKLAEGGRWTSKEQLGYAERQAERIARIEAFDAALGAELRDIRSMMVEIAKKLNSIEANQIREHRERNGG
jgi:hypothetical protein